MMTILDSLGHWSWFILGAVLLGLEIVAPGAFLLWFGLSAVLTGALALVIPMSWQIQALVFVVLAIVSAIAGRRFYAGKSEESDDPLLNQRSARFIGRSFVLDEAISSGTGRVRIDDTYWRVSGPDCGEGTRVKVTGSDGAVLTVEPETA
ncbi:NfeD family protein [Coralliovum pocilloporae]|uniref:NfeD family protein n=1 Tax=Coralliovum pocilloporae TaxID=3066369 RepID=UPI0033075F14